MLACEPACGWTLACSAPKSCFTRSRARILDDVDVLAAAVVALRRIAFGVLVGEDRPRGLQHGGAGVVLGGDQFEAVDLPALFR